MTVQKEEQTTKRVEFKATDGDRQIATGVVMVPEKADLQGDWERPETIRDFAEDFMARLGSGEGPAEGGVMHAVWPEDGITLVENTVLDGAREIGGKEYPAGSWVQSWQFGDGELWSLVEDDILSGYSIGAREVEWGDPQSQDELPEEIDVAANYPDDEPVWELQDGTVVEVSAVDIPAVPDAQILSTKSDAEKRLAEHLGDRDAFVEEALERGHDEEDAGRMFDVLSRLAEDGQTELEADAPDGVFRRAGKAFLSALSGPDDDSEKTSEAPDDGPEKEGRTLSRQNRESLYATIDASLDVLEDAGVDHGMTRFTDREDTTFDLSDHSARAWPKPDEDDEDGDEDVDVSPVNNAAGGDTPDDTTDMTNEDDPMAEAPEWAKAIHEQTEENSKRIDEALEDEEKGDDPLEDAPEWAKALHEQTEKNADRIDDISKQTGATESQQLGGAEKGGEAEGEIGDRQKFFIPASKRGGL